MKNRSIGTDKICLLGVSIMYYLTQRIAICTYVFIRCRISVGLTPARWRGWSLNTHKCW